MANRTSIEFMAVRLVLETQHDPHRPGSTEELDAMTREVFAAFRPRPLASTKPSNVIPMQRKAGAR